jgi:hypothetical protein
MDFPWATLIGLSQKNRDILIPPNISIFYQYVTTMVLFQGISWMHILSHFIAWVEILFLTLFMTIFKSLGIYCDLYLLIKLIVQHPKAQCFDCFFFFLQRAIWLAYDQKHYEIPLPQEEITFIYFTYIGCKS